MKPLNDEFWNSNEIRAELARTFVSFQESILQNPEAEIWEYGQAFINCVLDSTPFGDSAVIVPHFLQLVQDASEHQKPQLLLLLANWIASEKLAFLRDENIGYSKEDFLVSFNLMLAENLSKLDHPVDRVRYFQAMAACCGDFDLAHKLLDLVTDMT